MLKLNTRNLVILSSPRSGSNWYSRLLHANLSDQGFQLLSEIFNSGSRDTWYEIVDGGRVVESKSWAPGRFHFVVKQSPSRKLFQAREVFADQPPCAADADAQETARLLQLLQEPSQYRYLIKEIYSSVKSVEALSYLTSQEHFITHRRDKWAQLLSMLIATHTGQWVREANSPLRTPELREVRPSAELVSRSIKTINDVTLYVRRNPQVPCVYYEDMFKAPERALSLIGLDGSLTKATNLTAPQLGDADKSSFFANIDEVRERFEREVLSD